MAKKYINWKTKGMNRDTSVSAFNSEFAFENINVRLATNEGNTLMSWVNEKGPKKLLLRIDTMPLSTEDSAGRYTNVMTGAPIGTAVLNHQLVVFTHDDTNNNSDNIYVFTKANEGGGIHKDYNINGKLIYHCDNNGLGFSTKHPLETLVSYESENIQKVYWTDGINQPRMINVAPSMLSEIKQGNTFQFDFIQELALKEKVLVSKIFGEGEFPPGVIQYAFTYYNKYGQETNIFHTTPLQYISYVDRGGSPDGKIANSFKIQIANIDKNFDYLRIYSILRTSVNATPFVKRVIDLPIAKDKDENTTQGAKQSTFDLKESNFDDFGKEITIKQLVEIPFYEDTKTGLGSAFYIQGAAAYDKYLFQAYIGGKYIDVVDLETNKKVATLDITDTVISSSNYGQPFSAYHGNVLSFGKDKASGSDFPYLYYSCENNNTPCIMVIKIDKSNWTGKIAQWIYLPKCSGGASQSGSSSSSSNDFTHYFQNGCVDAENDCIWVSGYTLNSYKDDTVEGNINQLVYRKYPLPKVSEEAFYFSVQEVQQTFKLPFKKGTQGIVIRNNKLYQTFGYNQQGDNGEVIRDMNLDCIDLIAGQLIVNYNFPKESLLGVSEELESPYIYKDNLYFIAAKGKSSIPENRYYILWSLSAKNSGSGGGTGGSDGIIVAPSDTPQGDTTVYDITYIDNGLSGDSIDPTELLYKGGDAIIVQTLEQKDGTLFLGNLKIEKLPLSIKDTILSITGASKSEPLIKTTDNSTLQAVLSERVYTLVSKEPFSYINTLSSPVGNKYQGVAGFKGGEIYRLGIQFQHKTGKWSEPYWIGDVKEDKYPSCSESYANVINVPEFKLVLDTQDNEDADAKSASRKLLEDLCNNEGYRKIRPVIAIPSFSDRTILCQGVGCPTMYRKVTRYSDAKALEQTDNNGEAIWSGSQEGTLYAQSSWLFRTPHAPNYKVETIDGSVRRFPNEDASDGGGYINYEGKLDSHYSVDTIVYGDGKSKDYLKVMSPYLRNTEVMGYFDDGHSFYIDDYCATIHSPELEFDNSFNSVDLYNLKMRNVGGVQLLKTYGDIDIKTTTTTIGSDAAGFIHKSIVTNPSAALISGSFYNDYIVYERNSELVYSPFRTENPSLNWPVFMWHKNGSLNNDVQRNNRSAELQKKKISNYRLGGKTYYYNVPYNFEVEDMQLFSSDELSMVKVNGHIYMGNIDSMVTPSKPSRFYFIGIPFNHFNTYEYKGEISTDFFNEDSYYRMGLKDPNNTDSRAGIWRWAPENLKPWTGKYTWKWVLDGGIYDDVGNFVKGLLQWRDPISIKYKSTPHIVVKLKSGYTNSSDQEYNGIFTTEEQGGPYGYGIGYDTLPVVEIYREYNKATLYGGTSDEALRAATWIPCGPSEYIDLNKSSLTINYKWGDTYFQRFECLKTYPFTHEDKNQVIEIASFMCETRVNIDGRYDRNRAQVSNLNMTPQNFNLMNPIYSQMDNFFSYKMLDDDSYKNLDFPNTITWTMTKQNGADVDLWTHITMASTLEMDGNKGAVNKLIRFNNQLLSFQDSGIAQILYNENVQIATTEGVPIELANSGKVQGKRYYLNTVGCSNKWSVVSTPAGIYFIDSNDKSIYLFNGQIANISTTGGFNTWAKQNISSAKETWNPKDFDSFVAYYDKLNQDILFLNKEAALAFSEKFNCFTSFYDYGNTPYFCNLDDMGIWIKGNELYQHHAGEYCNFFGENKPFSMTLIGNQEPLIDKVFTNLEFRACVEDEGIYNESTDKFTPTLPFDILEVWNEYQHGILSLHNRVKGERFTHGTDSGILARKFRIWRCDIPRDNAAVNTVIEAPMGIKRFKTRPLDRIRNPWAYIKLTKNAASENSSLSKTEIHDIMATYFG